MLNILDCPRRGLHNVVEEKVLLSLCGLLAGAVVFTIRLVKVLLLSCECCNGFCPLLAQSLRLLRGLGGKGTLELLVCVSPRTSLG